MHLKTALNLLVILVLLSPALPAEQVTDPDGRIQVRLPEGWSSYSKDPLKGPGRLAVVPDARALNGVILRFNYPSASSAGGFRLDAAKKKKIVADAELMQKDILGWEDAKVAGFPAYRGNFRTKFRDTVMRSFNLWVAVPEQKCLEVYFNDGGHANHGIGKQLWAIINSVKLLKP